MALVEVEDAAVALVLDHVGATPSSLEQDNGTGGMFTGIPEAPVLPRMYIWKRRMPLSGR